MAAKKSSKSKSKPAKPTISKSAFIRKHPGLPAGEVSKLATKAGLSIGENLVYVVRSADRVKAKGKAQPLDEIEEASREIRPGYKNRGNEPKAASKGATKVVQGGPRSTSQEDSLEQQFVRLIMQLGTAKASQLFRQTLIRMKGIAG